MDRFTRAYRHKIRVGVVDHQPIVLTGLRNELIHYRDFTIVSEANQLEEAKQLVQSTDLEILIVDIDLCCVDDNDLSQVLSFIAQSTNPPVLIFTACTNIEVILLALQAGARGYVHKSEPPHKIVEAIHAILQGDHWMSSNIARQLAYHTTQQLTPQITSLLSEREIEVIQELAQGKDNRAVGETLHISERTVRFHLRNICDKLQMSRNEVIVWWVRQGSKLTERCWQSVEYTYTQQ